MDNRERITDFGQLSAVAAPAGRAPFDLGLAGTVAGCAVLTVLLLGNPHAAELARSATWQVAIATAALVIAVATTYFALTEFLVQRTVSSLAIAGAFCLLAMGQLGMALLPELGLRIVGPTYVPLAWALTRLVAAYLLVAAALEPTTAVRVERRTAMAAAALAGAVAVGALLTLGVEHVPTWLMAARWAVGAEIWTAVLFFGAGAAFWWHWRASGRPWNLWLALGLCVGGFAEIQYAAYTYQKGSVQAADLLRLAWYLCVLMGLAGEWAVAYRRIRRQARDLAALEAMIYHMKSQDLASVMGHIVGVVGDVLAAESRVVLPSRSTAEAPVAVLDSIASRPSERVPWPDGMLIGYSEDGHGGVTVAAPLAAEQGAGGMLLVTRSRGPAFTRADLMLLQTLASQASVLLERAMLYEEVAAAAVRDERSRLAREIHDGLAQHLAFLKMRVAWLQRSRAPIDPAQLRDIEQVLESALAEARQAITTLRSEPGDSSVPDAVSSYALEFGQISGMQVEVQRTDDIPEVGPKARGELLRIVQEALNNVRKHARATHVTVEVRGENDGLRVCVKDNGCGFVQTEAMQGHFGMDIMQERADSIGGELRILSTPGEGTSVQVWVPVVGQVPRLAGGAG